MTMSDTKTTAKDPICGMTVDTTNALHTDRDGTTSYFCSEGCKQEFLAASAGANKPGKP
jgi:Cu+-exporting ATPase